MSNTPPSTTVMLPSLGENVTEATISRWLKEPGERVEHDEPLLEVSTDKVDTEVPSPITGTLLEILVPEDSIVEIGGALAYLAAEAGEEPSEVPPPDNPPPNKRAPASKPLAPTAARQSAQAPAPAPAPIGESLSPATPQTRAEDRVEKLSRIRRTIARRMLESLHSSAQLTTVVEVDVTAIARLRSRTKDEFHQRTGVKLSFLPFFVAAAVKALADHPVINSSLNADATEVTYYGAVHLGMAVDSDKGLMVPVIHDADTLSIPDLAQSISDRADRVRTGTIRPDDLSGGTFTITNTGSRGALFDTPIINQPQSAILGIGTVAERVVPIRSETNDLEIGVRSTAYLSLSYDHRIVDGADAARYLTTVKQQLAGSFETDNLL